MFECKFNKMIFCDRIRLSKMGNHGEVSEWPMVQSWKDCVGAIPPGVRIPSSPVLSQTTGDQWNKINQKRPLNGRFWRIYLKQRL